MSILNFLNNKKSELPTEETEDLIAELQRREISENRFPLEVFHPALKPYINALVKQYDIPRPFVGLALLCAYSSAIGTAYRASMNKKDSFTLAIWACFLGESSSGKSLCVDKTFEPLSKIQGAIDREWDELTLNMKMEQRMKQQLQTLLYRDSHIPTLIRTILPDNPKGVTKMADELIEWINGMNQLGKKEGIDEQFWLSTWNGRRYSAIRSGKEKYSIENPFTNVVGGIQPKKLFRLFANDRDTNGFIYRMLFAIPEVTKLANVDPYFTMPEEWEKPHNDLVNKFFKELPVDPGYDEEPRLCILTAPAIKAYHKWGQEKNRIINEMDDADDKANAMGLIGKMKDYCLRFASILHLCDRVLELDGVLSNRYLEDESSFVPELKDTLKTHEYIEEETVQRAIKVADYFFTSGMDAYKMQQQNVTARPEVLVAATMMRMGKSYQQIAEVHFGTKDKTGKNKTKMYRLIKKWILEYPKVFNAVGK